MNPPGKTDPHEHGAGVEGWPRAKLQEEKPCLPSALLRAHLAFLGHIVFPEADLPSPYQDSGPGPNSNHLLESHFSGFFSYFLQNVSPVRTYTNKSLSFIFYRFNSQVP